MNSNAERLIKIACELLPTEIMIIEVRTHIQEERIEKMKNEINLTEECMKHEMEILEKDRATLARLRHYAKRITETHVDERDG